MGAPVTSDIIVVMKILVLAMLTASIVLAVDPPAPAPPPTMPDRFQIPQDYMTLYNGLVAQIQTVQKAVQAAEEKLRSQVCAERGIKLEDCDVKWESASYGKKIGSPVSALKPTPAIKEPSAPKPVTR
jgi:hypothetical protein